jgi:hypothetical protein
MAAKRPEDLLLVFCALAELVRFAARGQRHGLGPDFGERFPIKPVSPL